jgi:hypothetical protein
MAFHIFIIVGVIEAVRLTAYRQGLV